MSQTTLTRAAEVVAPTDAELAGAVAWVLDNSDRLERYRLRAEYDARMIPGASGDYADRDYSAADAWLAAEHAAVIAAGATS